MKLCGECRHWVPVDPERRPRNADYGRGGYCHNEDKITECYERWPQDALVYSYDEGGRFWTGPNFGCIHWEAK